MHYRIRTFDDPSLSAVCEPLSLSDDLSFLKDMRRICAEANGVGLGAPQIGVLKRAAFIWPQQKRGEAIFMLNPVIYYTSPTTSVEDEGCLSYPGISARIERHLSVAVRYFDETWAQHERHFAYFPARVVQHELDHLDGICRVGDFWKRQTNAA